LLNHEAVTVVSAILGARKAKLMRKCKTDYYDHICAARVFTRGLALGEKVTDRRDAWRVCRIRLWRPLHHDEGTVARASARM
jgi:hypothetical protein